MIGQPTVNLRSEEGAETTCDLRPLRNTTGYRAYTLSSSLLFIDDRILREKLSWFSFYGGHYVIVGFIEIVVYPVAESLAEVSQENM